MSVKIRLAVSGKKNQIAYRIVASDTRSKRDGKFLEILGFYNPTSNAVEKLRIEKDKIASWVKKGAIITPAVALLIEKGTLDRPKKPKVKKEEAQTAPPQTPTQAPTPPKPQKADQPTEKPAPEEVKEKTAASTKEATKTQPATEEAK